MSPRKGEGNAWTLPALVLASLALCLIADHAFAQNAGPFGVARPDGPSGGAPSGIFGWIAAVQSGFYRDLAGAIRWVKDSPAALMTLGGLSFGYGVFHAAGPGHGKAVISSYLIATGDGFRRGVALSAVAALLQAVTAVALIGLFAIVLKTTSMAMANATFWFEAASYLAVVAVGLWLVWRKGRSFVFALQGRSDHVHGPDCGHDLSVDPRIAEGRIDWRQAGGAVLAIGLRPCTGALVTLVFALAQGVFWAGIAAAFAMAAGTAVTVAAIAALAVAAKGAALRIASRRPGAGAAIVAGLEALAAVMILGLGALLLGGLIVSGTGWGG